VSERFVLNDLFCIIVRCIPDFSAPVPVLLSRGIIQKMLPLHSSEDLKYLKDNWVQAFFRTQPLGMQCLVLSWMSVRWPYCRVR